MPWKSALQRMAGRLALLLASLLPCSTLSLAESTGSVPLKVRPAAVAGSWYPADRGQLGALLDQLLAGAPAAPDAPAAETIRAIISPHAGYRFSGATAAAGYARVVGRQVQRVIVIGPAHREDFAGISIHAVDAYETPLGPVPLDTAAIARLRNSPLTSTVRAAHDREHSIEMQLPFLQRVLEPGWKLLPVLVGRLQGPDYRQVAALLQPLADATTLVVVSSDFIHYGQRFGFQPFPPDARARERIEQLDMGLYARIAARDAEGLIRQRQTYGLTVCGYRAIAILLEMLPPDASTYLADYTTSGKLEGNFRESVSYLSILVTADQPLAR
jgi:AmmeMemoRadiSam system protein B